MRKIAMLVALALVATGLFVSPAPAEGPQHARPDADVVAGEWIPINGTQLFETLDEPVRDDSDRIWADQTPIEDPAEVTLSDVTDPGVSTGHIVRWTHVLVNGDSTYELDVTLLQGATAVASWTHEVSKNTVWAQEERTLTDAQANSITDYTDLRLRFNVRKISGAANRNVLVSWAELEVPAASPPPPPPPPTCDITIENDEPVHNTDLVVPAGDKLCFEPGAQLIMDDSSILVYGTLEMRPGAGYIEFRNVDEEGFVGGGPLMSMYNGTMMHDPTLPCREEPFPQTPCAETDPGLWVLHDGLLDAQGTPKTPWTYDPATAVGWLPGDELRTTPIAPGNFDSFPLYTQGDPVPSIMDAFGTTRKAEVMNLTRDVVIRGQDATNRPHIFIQSTKPQTIKYTELRHLGPRKWSDWYRETRKVLGRWALHFHHNGDGSRGSVVEGNAMQSVGGHGYVPHASHGIRLERNIAYNIIEEAYWWDPKTGENSDPDTLSDSIQYIENIGAKVLHGGQGDVSGMFFSEASNSQMHGNVMVGVKGTASKDPAGYGWKTEEGHFGWDVHDNIAHNNNVFGGWIYGNPTCPNDLEGFEVYNNGSVGWGFDSYQAGYQLQNFVSSGSPTGLKLKSVGRLCDKPNAPNFGLSTQMVDARLHGTTNAIKITGHVPDATAVFRFIRCDLRGPTKVLIAETNIGFGLQSGKYDFIDCTKNDGVTLLEPSDLVVQSMAPDSAYRLQQPDGDAWQIHEDGSFTSIEPFYP